MSRNSKNWRSVFMAMLITFGSASYAQTEPPVVTTTNLTLHNRSGYKMFNSIWHNGRNCSQRMLFNPPLDINGNNHPTVAVPAGKAIAIGAAIYEMQGKSPVVCDYILSFVLDPSRQYLLEYDVHDRRCYGQLFRNEDGTYKLVTTKDQEILTELFPEFGWDQFEPGCVTQ